MGKAQRDKGLRGEREVAQAFAQAGFEVRGLDGQGDNLVVCADGLMLHLETKRQERLALPQWSRQAAAEAPAGALPLVVYRRSREPWRVSIDLTDLLALLQLAQPEPALRLAQPKKEDAMTETQSPDLPLPRPVPAPDEEGDDDNGDDDDGA